MYTAPSMMAIERTRERIPARIEGIILRLGLSAGQHPASSSRFDTRQPAGALPAKRHCYTEQESSSGTASEDLHGPSCLGLRTHCNRTAPRIRTRGSADPAARHGAT